MFFWKQNGGFSFQIRCDSDKAVIEAKDPSQFKRLEAHLFHRGHFSKAFGTQLSHIFKVPSAIIVCNDFLWRVDILDQPGDLRSAYQNLSESPLTNQEIEYAD